jgi:hypothetical protein
MLALFGWIMGVGRQRPAAAFALSLVGGIFVLLGGLYLLLASTFFSMFLGATLDSNPFYGVLVTPFG